MLVDLGRNDLSRVCVPGSVRVNRFMEPERYSHVTHLVSEVSGELRDGVTPFELLRACSPPAPSRAPEGARDADHQRARGPPPRHLRGAVGYCLPKNARSTRASRFARSGCATESRTCRRAAASSPTPIPAAEHEECLAKLRALEAAIDLAESEQL